MKKVLFFAAVMIGVLFYSISFGATYGGGLGTLADPYQVWTAEQMNTIGLNPDDWGKCFILMADIDMLLPVHTLSSAMAHHLPAYSTAMDT